MKQDMVESSADLLARGPIFGGTEPASLKPFLQRPGASFLHFARGEFICLQGRPNHSLGILVDGSAQVSKGGECHSVLMSTLHEGDVFGAVTLYGSRDDFVTRVTAITACTVLFLEKALVDEMLVQNPRFAKQYIAYLSDRIYFLNSRIDAFTGGTAESRLAAYLLAGFRQGGGASLRLCTSMNQLTQTLDIARASLYRAFEQLESSGAIRREGRLVYLLDAQRLRACAEG